MKMGGFEWTELDHLIARLSKLRKEREAAQCRRLADSITRPDDPTKAALHALADEFEANAKSIQAREAAARQIGLGDDIAPLRAD